MKIFTGFPPFYMHPSIAATVAIMQGDRPPRPTHPTFTDGLWVLMQRCWNQEPHSRPDMPEVLRILHNLLAPLPFHNQTSINPNVLFCASGFSSHSAHRLGSTLTTNDQTLANTTPQFRDTTTSHSTPHRGTSLSTLRPNSNDGSNAKPLEGQGRGVGRRTSLAAPPNSVILKQLHRLDRSSVGFHEQLGDILYGEEYMRDVPNLQYDGSLWLVDYLDGVGSYVSRLRSPLTLS